MCRKLALAATTLILGCAAFSVQAVADSAGTSAAAPQPAASAKPAPARKATAAERAAADRLQPLISAAFWVRETDLDPSDIDAAAHLSRALRAMGQYDEAVAAAQRALVIDPNAYDALMELARAQLSKGQGFYAIDPAQHAARLAPKDWRPLSLLGVAYTQVHRDDDAASAWRAALAISPNNPAVLANMAMSLAARGDTAGAEPLLRTAVAQPSADLTVRQDLALVLGYEGKLDEAQKLMSENVPPEQAAANMAYLRQVAPGQGAAQAAPAGADPHSWSQVKSAGG